MSENETQPAASRAGREEGNKTGAGELDILAAKLKARINRIARTPGVEKVPPAVPTTPVGIWKPVFEEGQWQFVRDEAMKNEWMHWAGTPKLFPKGTRQRVVLVGESVARGYLYDPYFTPARVLEHLLGEGRSGPEVIDLARVSIDLNDLKNLCAQCAVLEPDALVIFAGNNWHMTLYRSIAGKDCQELARVNQQEGLEAMWRLINSRLQAMIVDFVESIRGQYVAKGIPVVFILPEFNLLDWKSTPAEQLITHMEDEDTVRWIDTYQAARAAQAAGLMPQAAAAGQQLIALDFNNPLGYEIMAQCKLAAGETERAQYYLEKARDTTLVSRSTASQSRVLSITRATLLELADRYALPLVDLPVLFKAHLDGALPGRRLFLDYCHLTSEGIGIAMKAAATRLAGLMQLPADPEAVAGQPSAEVEAKAYFCAAVHNAHYGQSYDILHYLCAYALDAWPGIAELMVQYVDFATRKASNALCQSHQALVTNHAVENYNRGMGFLHARDRKLMDVELVDAILSALADHGVDIRARIHALRKEEHGIMHGRVDLLESFYAQTMYGHFPGQTHAIFQARNFFSQFTLVAEAGLDTVLRLIYRTPGRNDPGGLVTLEINGRHLSSLPCSEAWSGATVPVPGALVQEGVNTLTVRWPYRSKNLRKRAVSLPADVGELLNGLFEVFGEIHQLTAATPAPDGCGEKTAGETCRKCGSCAARPA